MIQTYISIGSVVVASISALYAYFSFKYNKKIFIISQTPILIPTFSGTQNHSYVNVSNNHESSIAKNVSIFVEKGKLTKTYSIENEFLSPGLSTLPITIDEDIDGCNFRISYLNIFDKKVCLSGTLYYIENKTDLQNIDFKIESVTQRRLKDI